MAIASTDSEPLQQYSQALPDVTITDTAIPDSYKWPVQELDHVDHDEYAKEEAEEVPVIDMLELSEDELHCRVREACGEWGFFQVVNHGVSSELLDRVESVSKEFFDLPLETKERLECKLEGDRVLGYGFPHSNKLKTSRRVWSEGLFMDMPRVTEFAATLWPSDTRSGREFCETMEEYFAALRDLGRRLVKIIMASLGVAIDAERMDIVPKEPALARLNHYPSCPDPSLTTGLNPHHDANLITILHQGSVAGLQVLKEGRGWVAVRPQPGAFAINAGNMLQVISNDRCISALHRAIVNKKEDRYSLAYFVQAPDWEHIVPLPELVDLQHPSRYRPFTWCEYLASQVQNAANGLDYFLLP